MADRLTSTRGLRRYENGAWRETADTLVNETALRLELAGGRCWEFAASPGEERELVCGFLLTQGIVASLAEIGDLRREGTRMLARLNAPASGNGAPRVGFTLPPWPRLFELFAEFDNRARLFRETGGSHSAALADGAGVRFFSEDIGRHNAIDKAVGQALLAGAGLSGLMLFSSGRVSLETVEKAAHAAVPAIVSPAAASAQAVERARATGIALVGFLRDRRFNLYAPGDGE